MQSPLTLLQTLNTLTLWITGRSQEFDVITMFRLPEPQSRKISNMHKLSMIFDQKEHFTSKLFDEFLFMKYEEFTKILTKPAWTQCRVSVKETEVVRWRNKLI